jgi:meiotically up-regulated gene 157 (Mug157) protein
MEIINVWVKSAPIVTFAKKIDKNKFNDRKKLSVVFDKAMSNMYENTIFSTLPCEMVEIHNITS